MVHHWRDSFSFPLTDYLFWTYSQARHRERVTSYQRRLSSPSWLYKTTKEHRGRVKMADPRQRTDCGAYCCHEQRDKMNPIVSPGGIIMNAHSFLDTKWAPAPCLVLFVYDTFNFLVSFSSQKPLSLLRPHPRLLRRIHPVVPAIRPGSARLFLLASQRSLETFVGTPARSMFLLPVFAGQENDNIIARSAASCINASMNSPLSASPYLPPAEQTTIFII